MGTSFRTLSAVGSSFYRAAPCSSPSRSGASLEQMALRDHAWGRFRSVRIQPFSFLSHPLFFFLSSLWKRAVRRKEPVRWKSTLTHPIACLYERTYASSFWSPTSVWRRNSHSGNWFTPLCARITSPQPYTSYLHLSHISLFKVTHIQKSYVYRNSRYVWDPRRQSQYSVRHSYLVLTACWISRRISAGTERRISWKVILRFSICYVWT